MLRMSSKLDTIIDAYKTLSKIPSLVGGRINNASNKVTSLWTVRNLDKGKKTKYTYEYFLDKDLNVFSQSDFGTDVSNVLLSALSPKETYKAIIKEEKDIKDVKKQYLEVWEANRLAHCVDLTALDIHGDVYADSEFGVLEWDKSERNLVYIAEKKPEKSEPYIKRKPFAKADGSGDIEKGKEYIYRQDWGEQLVGKVMSVIVKVELPEELFVVEELRDSWCPGQVRFTPDGKLASIAWETEPRRLGLIFCTNRPSHVFTLDNGHLEVISPKTGIAVRSLRVGSHGTLVWLQRAAGGPHHACHTLMMKAPDAEKVQTVVDIVQTSVAIKNGTFYGIYSQGLPDRCFSSSGDRLVFSTPQQNEVRAYVVDIATGNLIDISIKENPGSTSVLDVNGDVIAAVYSNMTTPTQMYVARLPAPGQEDQIKWVRASEPIQLPGQVASSTVEYLSLEHQESQDFVKSFTALYFSPNGATPSLKLPLIVWPHGGPHSGFVNSYALETTFFNMLGFATIKVNYRGSIGSGEESVRCLLGHVGNYELRDCYLALTTVLDRDTRFDQVVLYGGSFGGFINAHLAGQYPSRFKAMVLRNPLVDLATKGIIADNSDGCAVEAGFDFTEQGPVPEDNLLAMRRCSPLVHAYKIKAPTAFMLGSGDKRVPMYQGLELHRRLKANGVFTRVYMYDDNHSLSSPAAEMDNLINGAKFFFEFI